MKEYYADMYVYSCHSNFWKYQFPSATDGLKVYENSLNDLKMYKVYLNTSTAGMRWHHANTFCLDTELLLIFIV